MTRRTRNERRTQRHTADPDRSRQHYRDGGALWYYGYLHFAKPEDALLLQDFTMLKTVPGEDYKVSLEPAAQVAQCADGVLVLFDTQQKGLSGVLVDSRKRAVRCVGADTPQQVR